MDLQNGNNNNCPRTEIAAYIDGELSPADELVLEHHFAVCKTCLNEVNLQKRMLCALDFAFKKNEDIDLPENFTKVVIAKAANDVSGLRSKSERIWALSIFSVLLLLLIVGLGFEPENYVSGAVEVKSRLYVLASFTGRLLYDFGFGLAVILRCISQKIVYSSGFIGFSLFSIFLLFALTSSKLILRLKN